MHNQQHLDNKEQFALEYIKIKKSILCKKQKIKRIQSNINKIMDHINIIKNGKQQNKEYLNNVLKQHTKYLNENIDLIENYQEILNDNNHYYDRINNEYSEICKEDTLSNFLENLKL